MTVMDYADVGYAPSSDPLLRHESHHIRTATAQKSAVAQIMAPYRHNKMAAVAKGFQFKPGFLYTQVRAIAARINQNYDGWPSQELKKSFRTFIGKPVFVNHQNDDPKKARGKVVAARYVESGDDRYIETIMEVDGKRFPKLAHEIITGGLDSVSMGVEAGFTICSYCDHKAVDTPDFCAHVKFHKGEVLPRINARTGAKEDVLVYEKCYKLGFFELSYVFDPADETAVASRVVQAAAAEAAPPPDEIVEGEMPTPMMPQASRYHLGYGEVEAPEDVDTLRDEDNDDGTDDFKHYVESPKELRGPDLDQTKQLDREQEQEGLDADRRVEDVEDIGGQPMPARNSRGARRRQNGPGVLVHPITGQRYYAAEDEEKDKRDDAPPPEHEDEGPDDFGGGSEAPPEDDGGEDDFGGGDDSFPPGDDGGGDDAGFGGPPPGGDDGGAPPFPPEGGDDGSPHKSDQDLLQEAEQDLMHADALAGDDFSMDPGSDAGGTDDDYSDQDPGMGGGMGGGDEFGGGGDDLGFGDDDDGEGGEHVHIHHHFDDDDEGHPGPDDALGLLGMGAPPPPPAHQARRNGNSGRSNPNKRRGGSPMGLAQRGRVATAGRRRHYADDSGHTDGGPYHVDDNDQGEKEDTFISETPGSEALAAPTPGDGTISNTENNLVAALRRNAAEYQRLTGKRLRFQAEAVETPDTVNPTVNSGPGAEAETGDNFESIALPDVQTQPDDGHKSAAAFRAFDTWLRNSTGKTARQHGSVSFIRRAAAQWCRQNRVSHQILFPTMGTVLREAQRSEGARRAAMKRRADESLEVAAPQDRIDVEAPVRDTTDSEAQASQYDLTDFGNNAGDGLADPELSPDSQIWAPGEGNSSVKKDSNRKTDGMTAVRYAEAYLRAGLSENTPQEKWKIAGLAMTMRYATIADRISMLDAVNAVNAQRFAALRRQAGMNRQAARGIPQGFGSGQRQLTAGAQREAAVSADDSAIFLK